MTGVIEEQKLDWSTLNHPESETFNGQHMFIRKMEYSPDKSYGLIVDCITVGSQCKQEYSIRMLDMHTGELSQYYGDERFLAQSGLISYYWLSNTQLVLVTNTMVGDLLEQRVFDLDHEHKSFEIVQTRHFYMGPTYHPTCPPQQSAGKLRTGYYEFASITYGSKVCMFPYNPLVQQHSGWFQPPTEFGNYYVKSTPFPFGSKVYFITYTKENRRILTAHDQLWSLELGELGVYRKSHSKIETLKKLRVGGYTSYTDLEYYQHGQYLVGMEDAKKPADDDLPYQRIFVIDLENQTTTFFRVNLPKSCAVSVYNDKLFLWHSSEPASADGCKCMLCFKNVYQYAILRLPTHRTKSLLAIAADMFVLGRNGGIPEKIRERIL